MYDVCVCVFLLSFVCVVFCNLFLLVHFFCFISNLVFNLSLELLAVFVKMRLKVANKLLGVIENPRLELLRIANLPVLENTLGDVVVSKQSLHVCS